MSGKFGFILLDQLAVIRGWHDKSQSGISSNEVRDTTMEVFVVKAFKGGTLATGLYRDIRDRVNNMGANFHANLYIAFRNGNDLAIGSLQLKGSALGAWMEFAKKNRSLLYSKAIQITGYKEGKKGKITFRTPEFVAVELSPESDQQAKQLDAKLQEYLNKYLSRPRREQADAATDAQPDPEPQPDAPPDGWEPSEPPPSGQEDDVPF